ncbi:MAG: glycosyltransferase, partial [Candidatus Thorarchaeota archaeon]
LRPVVEKMVGSLGLGRHVFLRGRLPDEELYDLIRSSHIYISASLTDSTSVSLLEAMALGAFPIVSDLPANREWVIDGENGLLFRPGSPEDLCAKVERAISLQDLLLSSRERNKRLITQKAHWEKNMALVRGLLKTAVGRTRRNFSKDAGGEKFRLAGQH